jgi:hypothetical protein
MLGAAFLKRLKRHVRGRRRRQLAPCDRQVEERQVSTAQVIRQIAG